MKQFIKEKLNVENLLCFMIIICPILDILSFLFRNYFNTNFSPSTFLRPIIPIIVILIIFFKEKMKLKLIVVGIVYAIYAVIHLWLFNIVKTGSSFGGLINELQFIVNYSFMILNLFIFIYIFKDKPKDKLKKSILIMTSIYIISIWISIITNTSTTTYIEGIGYKGWFETGNSIGAILILSMFIIFTMIREKKYRYWAIAVIILVGIYTTMMLGTRVGLFGFICVLFLYGLSELLAAILKRIQLNKNILIISISVIVIIVIGVTVLGSNTLKRRQHLKEVQQSGQEVTHISNALLEIKEKIQNNELEEGYMSEAGKKSIIDLYNFANEHEIANNDMRAQQLIYNIYLVKNQSNIMLMLFGNGFQANFTELILEMEIPAFLLNFGVFGFILYFVPLLTIFIYGLFIGVKYRHEINSEYIMNILGIFFSFAFSFLSGYTFFNSSSMIIVIVLNTLLIINIRELKNKKLKERYNK